jgi:hypothetical protein
MSTYGGVTPTLIVNTKALQSTEKLSPSGGKLVRDRNGVCMALVLDWIRKCHEIPGGVTDTSQLKSGISLAVAQTAYMRGTFGAHGTDDAFIQSHGLSVRGETDHSGGGNLQSVATKLAGLVGYAWIGVRSDLGVAGSPIASLLGDLGQDQGHAMGYRHKDGVIQLFDPNIGILQFASSADFGKWFCAYVAQEYPDLVDKIIVKEITH